MKNTVLIVGPEGCGKTSFLTGLLCLGARDLQFSENQFCVAGTEESQSYLNELGKSLRDGIPPSATLKPRNLSFDVIHKGEQYEFRMQDILLQDTDSYKRSLYEYIKGSDIILFMLDIQRDVCNGDRADYYERFNVVLDILARKDIVRSGKRIAVILSKADLYDYSKHTYEMDPLQFLQINNPILVNKFQALKLSPSFFFLSSLGSDMKEVQDLAPIGYESIFRWMSPAEQKQQQKCAIIASALAFFLDGSFLLVFAMILFCIGVYIQKTLPIVEGELASPDGERIIELSDNDAGTDLGEGIYHSDQLSRMGGRVATKVQDAGTPFVMKKTFTTKCGTKVDAYYAVHEDPKDPESPNRGQDGRVRVAYGGKPIYTESGESKSFIVSVFDSVRLFFKGLFGK